MRIFLLAAALSVTVLACMTPKADKSKVAGANLSDKDAKALDEIRAEIEIGRNMAGRLLGYYGIIDDDKIIGYVNQVGSYVASYGDFPERKYMFAILKHESINAFACPGGYILVTIGALRAAKNEAELAAILGHEVAHVGKKHMLNTLKDMKEKEMEKTVAEGDKKLDPALRMRERPKGEESAAGATIAKYMLGKGGASLNILKAAAAGMSLITEKGLDKELEFEADHEGVKWAIRAGYEPKAMNAYLKRLGNAKDSKTKNLGKTHPSPENRIKKIEKLLKTLKAEDIVGASGEERFDRVKKTFPKAEKD